jgi:15-cis-phytoene synthase
MPDAFAHCEQLVRAADKDRFLAGLFAPAQRRGALFALYAFNVEVARVRELVHNPLAGEIRLQWWRDALERPGAGDARANPVAAAFLDTIVRFRLPVRSALDLIEARSFDLYNDPMPTMAALEAYADKTSTVLFALAAQILDGRAVDIAGPVRHGGIAFALTGLLRAFPLHASRGQMYLPLEVAKRHGVKPKDVFAGRGDAALEAALAELRGIARGHYEEYDRAAAELPRSLAPVFLPLALVPLYLNRLERSRRRPFRLIAVPQWRRQWALWRAARRA